MRHNGFWILVSTILLAASVVPGRANLITDPGFESCASAGDTPPDWTASSANADCSLNPHTGSYSADFADAASTLSQTITTIAGDNYDFSFWLEREVTTPDFFTASFGGDQVLDLVNESGFAGYTLEDFTVAAAGTSTTIELGGENSAG